MPLTKDLLHNNCGMTLIETIRGSKPEIPEEMKKNKTRAILFLFGHKEHDTGVICPKEEEQENCSPDDIFAYRSDFVQQWETGNL